MNLIIYIQYVANTFKFVKRQPTPLQGIQYYPLNALLIIGIKVGNPCTHLTIYKEYHLMGSYFP